jgi:hypothetical protein
VPRRRFGSDLELTDEDKRALAFVKAFTVAHGRTPTLQEVSGGCGWKARTTAQRHLNSLTGVGELRRDRKGRLVVPGTSMGKPALAPLLDDDDEAPTEWVVAPRPGLVACVLRVRDWEDPELVSDPETYFADPEAEPLIGETVLAFEEGEGYFLAEFHGELKKRARPERSLVLAPGTLKPTGVELVGPIRYTLFEWPHAEGAAPPPAPGGKVVPPA